MKKIIISGLLCVIIVIQFLSIASMNSAIDQNTEYIEALEHYIKAQICKKDAQLFLMNSLWNNPEVHKLLADSCKNDCIKYKNGK